MNYDNFIYQSFFVMFFFRHAGKFVAVFASIPFPIFAALYCILFGLVGMSFIILSEISLPYAFVLLFTIYFSLFIHQLRLKYHFSSLQTWTLWEILLSLGLHCSLEYLFVNFSISARLLRDLDLFILTPDGWV